MINIQHSIQHIYIASEEILIMLEDITPCFEMSKSDFFRMLNDIYKLNKEEYSFLEMLLVNKEVITSNDINDLLYKLDNIEL